MKTSLKTASMIFMALTALIFSALGVTPARAICLPDAITVTNANDSGAGSLRQAITDICTGGTITFDPTFFSTAQTITLASDLKFTKDLTIDGSTVAVAPSIGNNTSVTVFNVPFTDGGNLTLDSLTITGGGAGVFMGASKTLTVLNSTISQNTYAGVSSASGTLIVQDSTFFQNGSGASDGGAIYTQANSTITNSTFLNNSASINGGAIQVWGTTTIVNSTFNGNTAGQAGGAISVSGTLTLINSTLSGNSATWDGNQLFTNGGTMHLYNSILANGGNYNSDCRRNTSETVDGTNNIIRYNNCGSGTTNLIGGEDPLVGALGNYGGITQTMPLLPGSPAIDAGDSATCANAATVNELDQRGVTRPQGSACDIGAFESQGFTLTKTNGDDQSASIHMAFANPLALTVSSSHSEPVDGGIVTFTAPASGATLASTSYSSIIASGAVSQNVTANGTTGGPYTVTASAAGAAASVDFALTNLQAYSVTYNGNGNTGGSTPANPIYYQVGDTVTVLANVGAFSNKGYTFSGWNTQADGLGTTYMPSDTFSMGSADLTLYAKWIAHTPTNISLSNNNVAENKPVGTVIGTLSTTDADAGDVFIYSFACAAPGVNDSLFMITGSNLKTKAIFNYESKKTYAICIRTTDKTGAFFDKKFTVSVTDVNEETLKNGLFDLYPAGKKIPTNWVAANFGVNDGKDTVNKQEGAASVKIVGETGKTKTLTQTVTMSGALGDTFTFSYYTKASVLPAAGICQAQVMFYSGAALKGTKILKCPVGATYTWKLSTLNFTAPAAYTKVVVVFTFAKSGGTVWFDAASLMR